MRTRKRIVILVIVLLVVGNVALVLRVLVTPEKLRSVAEAELQKLLPGATIESAAIERFLGQVRFDKITVPRPEGQPIVSIESIRASFAPLTMLSDRPVVNHIELRSARVDGLMELKNLLPKPPPEKRKKKLTAGQIVLRNCELEIEAGTLYHRNCPRIILKDINAQATAVSPGSELLRIKLSAKNEPFGPIRISGELDVESKTFSGKVETPDVELTQQLRRTLRENHQRVWDCFEPTGRVSIHTRLDASWAGPRKRSYFAVAQAHRCTVTCRWFPLRLHDVEGTIELDGPTCWLKNLRGRRGTGVVRLPQGTTAKRGRDVNIEIIADNMALDDQLKGACPKSLQKVWNECQVTGGTADVNYRLIRKPDPEDPKGAKTFMSAAVRFHSAQACHKAFPLPVQQVSGTVKWVSDRGTTINLTGRAGAAVATIRGTVPVKGPVEEPNLTVQIDQLPFDETLKKAIPPDLQKLWPVFQPEGRVNATATLLIDPSSKGPPLRTVLVLPQGSSITYQGLPLKMANVSGKLRWENETLHVINVTGQVRTADVKANGSIVMKKPPTAPNLKIDLRNLSLTPEVRSALPSQMQKIWDDLRPGGLVDIVADVTVDRTSDEPSKFRLAIRPHAATARHVSFPYPVTDLAGDITVEGDRAQIDCVRGRAGRGDVNISGTVTKQDGASTARLEVGFQRLALDDVLRDALPDSWKKAWKSWKPTGLADGALRLLVHTAKAGEETLKVEPGSGIELNKLTGFGLRLPDLSADVTYANDKLTLDNISGEVYGGRLSGKMESLTSDSIAHKGSISLYGVDLKQMFETLKVGKGEVRGVLSGDVTFSSKGSDLNAIVAKGKLRVERGNLGKVPAIYQLITVLSLHWPKGTVITDAELDVLLEKGVIHVKQVTLKGTGLPIIGTGTVGLDGKLDLNFITGRKEAGSLLKDLPLVKHLFSLIDKGLSEVKKYVIQIKVTGTLKQPDAAIVPLGGIDVTAPVKAFFNMLIPQGDKPK